MDTYIFVLYGFLGFLFLSIWNFLFVRRKSFCLIFFFVHIINILFCILFFLARYFFCYKLLSIDHHHHHLWMLFSVIFFFLFHTLFCCWKHFSLLLLLLLLFYIFFSGSYQNTAWNISGIFWCIYRSWDNGNKHSSLYSLCVCGFQNKPEKNYYEQKNLEKVKRPCRLPPLTPLSLFGRIDLNRRHRCFVFSGLFCMNNMNEWINNTSTFFRFLPNTHTHTLKNSDIWICRYQNREKKNFILIS